MAKRYIHNDTANVVFMGGVLIPPGEGREIAEEFLPPDAAAAAPAEAEAGTPDLQANLVEMLSQSVKHLLPLLADLGDDTLAELARIEGESDTPRKSLLSAIGELQLERAQAKAGAPT